MKTRAEHLAWCKARALAELERGDVAGAIVSMISDLGKWEGGELYDPLIMGTLTADGLFFQRTAESARTWIEGFH